MSNFVRLTAPAPAGPLLLQVQLHVAARLAWSKALAAAHRLDFDGAIPHAHTAARSARAFRDLAAHTEKLLLLRCVAARSAPSLPLLYRVPVYPSSRIEAGQLRKPNRTGEIAWGLWLVGTI